MTHTHAAFTVERDSACAGNMLGNEIREAFEGAAADALIVFASAQHDHAPLLASLAETTGTRCIVGSSSAGEFTDLVSGEGAISVLALRSPDMKFAVGVGERLSSDVADAARRVVSSFNGLNHGRNFPYRSALVMTDALAGFSDAVVEEMTLATGGDYCFFGGGAGDDGRFEQTHVFAGTRALDDAVVALEILSSKPLGVGVSHGWEPAGAPLRVTECDGMRLIGLNGAPAMQAFQDHAVQTGQTLDPAAPLPFFLHNVLGIEVDGQHRLRVPLGLDRDGAVNCAAPIRSGAVVRIMSASEMSAVLAAEQATRAALAALGEHTPAAALVFDCVATRQRLGRAFEAELHSCAEILRPAQFVGCNTYGQIARAEGQFGGFHNCTAVVCILPV